MPTFRACIFNTGSQYSSLACLLYTSPIINIGTVGVYLYFFKDVADSDNSNKVIIQRLFTVLAVILILLVTTIGVLSEPLIRKLQHPFFIMVRDLSVFGVVERVESVVIALWVVSDIVYVSMLLKICGEIFSKVRCV